MKAERRLLLILLILLPLFFIGGPEYDGVRSYKAFWNVGHIIFFALAARYMLAFGQPKSMCTECLLVLLLGAIAGVMIELVQFGLSRSADVLDIVRNEIGALIGLLWFYGISSRRIKTKSMAVVIVFALSGVLWSAGQIFVAAYDEYRMQRDFPVLADFESSLEVSRWSGEAVYELSRDHVAHGQSALKIRLDANRDGASRYSGLKMNYLMRDWSGYQSLLMEVFNAEEEAFEVTVRIHDKLHRRGDQPYNDRFNRRFQLMPGWNLLAIPLGEVKDSPVAREMDISAIESIGLFTGTSGQEKIVYLDNIRLLAR